MAVTTMERKRIRRWLALLLLLVGVLGWYFDWFDRAVVSTVIL